MADIIITVHEPTDEQLAEIRILYEPNGSGGAQVRSAVIRAVATSTPDGYGGNLLSTKDRSQIPAPLLADLDGLVAQSMAAIRNDNGF